MIKTFKGKSYREELINKSIKEIRREYGASYMITLSETNVMLAGDYTPRSFQLPIANIYIFLLQLIWQGPQ